MSEQLGFDFVGGGPKGRMTEEELVAKREEIQTRVSSFHLDNTEHKVAWVLNQYPQARDSDPFLFATYCRVFYPDVAGKGVIRLEQMLDLPSPWTLSRSRRRVQNTYGMFKASPAVQKNRGVLQGELVEKHAGEVVQNPAINVYADESGKTQQHLVVGSIWFVAPINMLRFTVEFTAWKDRELAGQEVHFKKISKGNVERYKTFVDQFIRRDPLIGFKSLHWSREGIADVPGALCEMFYHLLRNGIGHEDETGRAALPRTVNFVKDRESAGSDQRLLAGLRDQLTNASRTVFGGRLTVGRMDVEASDESPFLQVADLFTSSVSRLINESGEGPKDEFARYFLAAVGAMDTDGASDRAVSLST